MNIRYFLASVLFAPSSESNIGTLNWWDFLTQFRDNLFHHFVCCYKEGRGGVISVCKNLCSEFCIFLRAFGNIKLILKGLLRFFLSISSFLPLFHLFVCFYLFFQFFFTCFITFLSVLSVSATDCHRPFLHCKTATFDTPLVGGLKMILFQKFFLILFYITRLQYKPPGPRGKQNKIANKGI